MGLICTPYGYSGAAKVSGLSYQGVILGDKPVAYWPLNETSGAVANDLSGNGNNLTISGFTLAQPAIQGSLGLCMLAQNSSAAMTPSGALTGVPIGGSEYTLEIWVNGSTLTTAAGGLIGYGAPAANEANGLLISNSLFFNYWYSNNADFSYSFVNDDTYHLVATYNGAERNLYINGVSIGILSGSGMAVPSTENFSLGSIPGLSTVGVVAFYSNAAIYNTALTAAQILNHYNAGIA